MSPVQPTISYLVKQSIKDQKSAIYAAKCLEFLVKAAPIELYSNESEQQDLFQILHCLCKIMDQGQAKKVKFAKPALLYIQGCVGGANQLKTLAQSAYAAYDTGEEEDLTSKIASIIDNLTAPR